MVMLNWTWVLQLNEMQEIMSATPRSLNMGRGAGQLWILLKPDNIMQAVIEAKYWQLDKNQYLDLEL